MDVMGRAVGGEDLLEVGGDAAGEVADRPRRPGDREVVAGARQHARVAVEIAQEAADERRLADAGLAGEPSQAPIVPQIAPDRSSVRSGMRRAPRRAFRLSMPKRANDTTLSTARRTGNGVIAGHGRRPRRRRALTRRPDRN